MVAIAFNITRDQGFIDDMNAYLWLGVAQAALAMAALGWLAARRGLLPLRRFSATVATISAERLDKPLPEAGMPVELRELVSAFNGMLRRLEDSFRRLSEVSSDMAHELRTPLHNLLMQTQVTLSRERDAADYRATLQSNLEEFERLARMVSDMLFLARADNREIVLETGARRAGRGSRPAARLLRSAGERSRHPPGAVRRRHRSKRPSDDSARPFQSSVQRHPLHARREGGNGSDLAATRTHATVRVENPGLQHTARASCRRSSSACTGSIPSRREGNSDNVGLGLAITKSIVEMHGGRVEAESDAGRTCFTLTLPLRA